MLQGTVYLDLTLQYLGAIYEQRNVYVQQDSEIIGYGRIVDVTRKVVTIINYHTQQVEHYLRDTCQFYAEEK